MRWMTTVLACGLAAGLACVSVSPDPSPTPSAAPAPTPAPTTEPVSKGDGVWSIAFDASEVGALSSVWGTGPDNVFVVGGTFGQGEVYHYDGSVWRGMVVPAVQMLVWVFGFAPDDVYAVGVGGGVIHFDGTAWTALDSVTSEDLWGVWGTSPQDLWIVGGTVGDGEPVLLHFDGENFTPHDVPENDLEASALFKVWGIGSKVYAVGANGLIIERADGVWRRIDAGPQATEDFVSLWGTSEANIVVVGGRTNAQIAQFDGTQWTTLRPFGRPGMNGCFIDDPEFAVIGGATGWVGRYTPSADTPVEEDSPALDDIHAVWGDGAGRYYAVGGQFRAPFRGVALVRTPTEIDIVPGRPIPPRGECTSHADCDDAVLCTTDQCLKAVCVNTPLECDDGDPCTQDRCNQGVCENLALNCDDFDPCTVDICSLGLCFSFPMDCDDADGCTQDACNNGVCVYTPTVCNDGNLCTVDSCAAGACVYSPLLCNDSNACTVDSCLNGVCVVAPKNCDDGNGCTADGCAGGVCTHVSTCGLDEICADGACVPAPDCFEDEDCDDGDPCREHACVEGECQYAAIVCDDEDACTVDACVQGACVFTPQTCDDGNACTLDACVGGACAFTPVVCNDGNACTTDVCVGGNCVFTPVVCDDGNACTSDACVGGNCVFTPVVCNDNDACTTNACVGGSCVYTPIPGCGCTVETDCDLGKNCVSGVCTAASGPDLEIGMGAVSRGCIRPPYARLVYGGEMPICEGFQGFTDVLPEVRVTGFPAGAQVQVRGRLAYVGGSTCTNNAGCPQGQTCNKLPPTAATGVCGPVGGHAMVNGTLTDIGDGAGQFTNFGLIIFDVATAFDGANVVFTMQVVQAENESTSATQTLDVTLRRRGICLNDTQCPEGHSCNGNYCIP